MKIIFIDPKCPKPYDPDVLATRGLGGTEATVIRVAEALSENHVVCVFQHNRNEQLVVSRNLKFLPASKITEEIEDAQHIIFIQKAQFIQQVAPRTSGRLWLWLHNFLGDEVPFFWKDHLRYRLGIICVSRTHALHTREHMKKLLAYWLSFGMLGRGGLNYLYNPIDTALAPDENTLRNKYKLVFFSSPYKGIEDVIDLFIKVHSQNNNIRLYVADPGYVKNFDSKRLDHPGIIKLGSLPQREILKHVREALCVFYPQKRRPETFGLVYAEANAVGTPVLAHDFGSAREVLVKENPPLNALDENAVFDVLNDWLNNGGPIVRANEKFRMSQVLASWESFLVAPENFQNNINF
ncbi:MAG: glycosyltransferase family 4 protein [Nitrosomonas sp.]|nr:glycosyltransferase family 4 protein [Nitrosomonas sp.]